MSPRHLVTVGGHAIDVVTQDIELKKATGEEEFVPFFEKQRPNDLPHTHFSTPRAFHLHLTKSRHKILRPDCV